MEEALLRKKKGPGRPKKAPLVPTTEILGIVGVPSVENLVVEFEYYNPLMFKKLCSMLNSLNFVQSDIIFMHDKFIIMNHVENDTNSTNVLAIIDGSKANKYYCKYEYKITVKTEILFNALKSATKGQSYKLFIKSYEDSFHSYIFIEINSLSDGKPTNSDKIPIITFIDNIEYRDISKFTEACPVSFILDSKNLKSTVQSIRKISKYMTIEIINSGTLEGTSQYDMQLSSFRSENMQEHVATYTDKDGIQLKVDLSENQIFSVTLDAEKLKSISTNLIDSRVKFYSDQLKWFIMHYKIDGEICNLYISLPMVANFE